MSVADMMKQLVFLACVAFFGGMVRVSAHDCFDYSVLIGVSEEEGSSVVSEVPA